MSDWFTYTSTRRPGGIVVVVMDRKSSESKRIVPCLRNGSLLAVADVAKAISGLVRLIWREISGAVLTGLAGETMTPRERREK